MELAQRQRFLAIVVAETERLTRLVNQVLDMAKIESGHADWHDGDADLGAIVQGALQSTAELMRSRSIRVETELPDALPPLHADTDRLTQVVLNLLSNAAKFVPEGRGLIRVRLCSDAAGVQVEVSDNGPGVPAEQQALIFEKFRQGGDETHRPQGTGLGLPISREIVEHYGGRIWLACDPGQATTFGFSLPWHNLPDHQPNEWPTGQTDPAAPPGATTTDNGDTTCRTRSSSPMTSPTS
jgi:signal transduction histidine kinase